MAVYNQTPEGMPGNDDTGEMSAWYVLAALGLYHATPGSRRLGARRARHSRGIVVHEGQRSLTIEAPGAERPRCPTCTA